MRPDGFRTAVRQVWVRLARRGRAARRRSDPRPQSPWPIARCTDRQRRSRWRDDDRRWTAPGTTTPGTTTPGSTVTTTTPCSGSSGPRRPRPDPPTTTTVPTTATVTTADDHHDRRWTRPPPARSPTTTPVTTTVPTTTTETTPGTTTVTNTPPCATTRAGAEHDRGPQDATPSRAARCGSGSWPTPTAATSPRSSRRPSATESARSTSRAATAPAIGRSSHRRSSPNCTRRESRSAPGSTSTAASPWLRRTSERGPLRDGADCLVIDAESQYQGRYPAAQTYIARLRKLIGNSFPVGLAGFPYVDYHLTFPYSVFLGPNGAQYNLPQMYWADIGTSVPSVFAAHLRVQRDLPPADLPAGPALEQRPGDVRELDRAVQPARRPIRRHRRQLVGLAVGAALVLGRDHQDGAAAR